MDRLITGIALILIAVFSREGMAQTSSLAGDAYLGQEAPGIKPVIFAPGTVSLPDQHEFGSVFSKDGKEFFFGVDVGGRAEIRRMALVDGRWTTPELLLSHHTFSYNDPMLSPDQQKLFLISDRPVGDGDEKKDYDIWYVERRKEGWSEPVNAGAAINSNYHEYYVSFDKSGSMYFSSNRTDRNFDVYYSAMSNSAFRQATPISDSVNTQHYEADVFVSPDQSYVIFCADRPEGLGKGDLYISFKKPDGTWTKSKNMGSNINTSGHELCPFVSDDGKYFFYTSNQDIYWVDASIISNR